MLGEDRAINILEKALKYCEADQVEAVLIAGDSQLTRFANSVIHQNVAESNAILSIRAIMGKRIGSASGNSLDDETIRRLAQKALEMAKLQKENLDFKSLPRPKPIRPVHTFFEATYRNTPEERAKMVGVMAEEAKKAQSQASGAFSASVDELAVANSLGIRAYNQSTQASLNVVMSSDGGSGYAEVTSRDVNELNFLEVAVEAIERCMRSKGPKDLAPGEYEVVLESYAAAELVWFLGYLGLGALAVQEGRSFMKFGERVVGGNISIWDDGLDSQGLAMPFDFEGVPKRRVDLIENGIAKAVVYDSYMAGKENGESTGHALLYPNSYGPLPLNLFLKPGDSSKAEMIAQIKRGILVTRFWYTNPVHPLKALITGMTRDGTFLIEDGKIKCAVKNLRFTESILKALSNVELIAAETKYSNYCVVPALKISKFNFSGVTE